MYSEAERSEKLKEQKKDNTSNASSVSGSPQKLYSQLPANYVTNPNESNKQKKMKSEAEQVRNRDVKQVVKEVDRAETDNVLSSEKIPKNLKISSNAQVSYSC